MKKPLLHLGCLLLAGTTTLAQQQWNAAANGFYDDPTRWTPSSEPTSGTHVAFDQSGTYTVTLRKNGQASNFYHRSGNVTFDLGGHTLAAAAYSFDGSLASGSSVVRDGTLTAANLLIGGGNALSARNVTLSNVTGTFTNVIGVGQALTGPTAAGTSGHSLTITDGSVISTTSSFSLGVQVDNAANNTAVIEGGSSVTVGAGLVIGVKNGATGNNLTVRGTTTQAKALFLQVGNANASGNQFKLEGGTLTIANTPGSHTSQYFLLQGSNGAELSGGLLDVRNTIGTGYLRASAGSSLIINGARVTTNLLRADSGDAGFTFQHGIVEAHRSTHTLSTFTVGDGGPEAATFRLIRGGGHADDGLHGFGALTIAGNGRLEGNGTITGATTINGTLDPGIDNALGAITFRSNVTLGSDAEVRLTLSGTGSAEHDTITLTDGGALHFGGRLAITLDGYSARIGDTFTLFDAASYTGDFATLDFSAASLSEGVWVFDASSGVLAVAVPEPSTYAALLLGGAALLLAARRTPLRHS